MADLSKTKARAMLGRFGGHITHRHTAHAEFTGEPPVLIPDTTADVGRAIALSQAAGRTMYVRSGARATVADVVEDASAAVLSLEAFASVDVELQRVTVGPAATIGDVATALRHRALFLPFPDQPTVSLAAAVLGEHRPPFIRSVGRRPLWEGVVEADIVPADRAHLGETQTLDAEGWRAFRAKGAAAGVVTRLVLDASHWGAYGGNRWVRAWMFPYSKDTFGPVCDQLLGRRAPGKVDMSVRASTDAYGAHLVLIRATGQGRARSERTRRFVEGALGKAKCLVLWSRKVDGAGASLAAWVGTGPGRAAKGEVPTRLASDDPWSPGQEAAYLDEVDRLVHAGAWVDLHLGSLFRRAIVPATAGAIPTTVLAGTPRIGKVALPPAQRVAPLVSTHNAGPIPGFEGPVYQRAVNDRAYRLAIQQYAVSSYDAAVVAARMTPLLVAVANTPSDVVCAINWAARQGHKVVGRSGGHQYCGLSSGGADTVLIDVKRLEEITFSPDGTHVTVGPGVSLWDLTKTLVKHGVSIPHGECPLVNLGGHVQTGGVGHQLRSLGLALDWVREFRMVAWDAQGVLSEHVYPMPVAGLPRPTDAVFAAVLGGGPGSWGILTSMTFEVARDTDPRYDQAYGYTKTYPYNRSGWAAAFEQMCQWSRREHVGTLPDGVDMFLSVISSNAELLPNINLRPAVVMVETTALDAAGDEEIRKVVDAVESAVSWIDEITGKVMDLATGSPNGRTPLSKIVDHGVRSTGALGGMPGGREFDMPYKKSLYITRDPMPQGFCDHFVELVDLVDRHPDVKVVFQGVIGGGAFQENGDLDPGAPTTTQMQHRDALVQVVFDVFYKPGSAYVAEHFQAQMLAIWTKYFPTETGRMFWGTFEDPDTHGSQLDMANPDTQARYYDSPGTYSALRQVKAAIDPTDVFHTSFTVRP